MRIGIPGEVQENENRVAATPDTVEKLQKLGFDVVVERGAGVKASFEDDAFTQAGAQVVDRDDVWNSDIILKVNAPIDDEIALLKDGATLASFIWPAQNEALMSKLSQRNVNILAMDSVPRLSRSQSLDALSSMANIGGYRAVVEASHEFGRFFNGQITAAGKIPPARVLVIGAGVAGLAALGAAGSMGAIVRAFDTRPEVKEQVQSMGAEFLELVFSAEEQEQDSSDGYAKEMSQAFIDAEMALFMEQAREVDIIITTALIPGKPAPRLITEEMVKAMKPGSVIVDLAAQAGGNCACTVKDQITLAHGVKVIGYTDLPSRLPTQSSQLYGTNLVNLLKLLCPNKDGQIDINFDDEVIRGLTVIRDGSITWPPPPVKVSAAPAAGPGPVVAKAPEKEEKARPWLKPVLMAVGAVLFGCLANAAPTSFLEHFTVFVLASIVGYYVIWNVTSALHTPLMSVTNAISGIVVVGGLVQMGSDNNIVLALSGIAITVAVINIVGGFAVTQRMLKMFRLD